MRVNLCNSKLRFRREQLGGLAFYFDQLAPGPMFPVYDGNGNVTRVCGIIEDVGVPEAEERVAFEYGPFGENLSTTGLGYYQQHLRFPFRWSTKYTDGESGLVYFGYHYYSPSTAAGSVATQNT